MEKVILFNEDEEYLVFPTAHDASKHLSVTQDKIVFAGKVNKSSKLKGYYVEFEEDKIVQYNFRNPVRVWHTIEEAADVLLVHPGVIKNSLRRSLEVIEKLHFKYFSETKSRPL